MQMSKVRASAEDLLLIANLADQVDLEGINLDLELQTLKLATASAVSDLAEQGPEFEEFQELKSTRSLSLTTGRQELTVTNTTAMVCDQSYLYIHESSKGLFKVGTGNNSTMGKVYAHKSDYRTSNPVCMAIKDGFLYIRDSDMKPTPFVKVDCGTLEEQEKPENFEFEKETETTLEWMDDAEKERSLTYTPLFINDNELTVISRVRPPKKEGKCLNFTLTTIDDEGEEVPEDETEEQKKERLEKREEERKNKPRHLYLETYDLSDPNFKFIR